jgi:hypothetical protein
MLDERIMGGHIEALPGSVNAYLRKVVLGLIVTRSAWHIRSPIRVGLIPQTSSARF